jgi:hypothetical protein
MNKPSAYRKLCRLVAENRRLTKAVRRQQRTINTLVELFKDPAVTYSHGLRDVAARLARDTEQAIAP